MIHLAAVKMLCKNGFSYAFVFKTHSEILRTLLKVLHVPCMSPFTSLMNDFARNASITLTHMHSLQSIH